MFSTTILQKDGWQVVELADSAAQIHAEIIPAAGAILNRFVTASGHNAIDGYVSKDDFTKRVHDGFRSAKLSPFVCRLNKSTYSWEGQTYTLDKFVWNGSALHGLLYDADFDIMETTADNKKAMVVLRYQYDGQHKGYPFAFNCTITYCLTVGGSLTITTHISNPASATSTLPICDGWHPYFTLGGKADDWFLEICSDQMMEYNEELIPTGQYVFNSSYYPGKLIGSDRLDNGFLVQDGRSPFCTLKNDVLKLEFIAQKNYPFLQLYIPDHRESIAIENLSGAPDAFNNGIGLTALKPGEKIDFEINWRITQID